MESCRRDRGRDCKSKNAPHEPASAVLRREPPQLSESGNCDTNSEGAAHERSGEKPEFAQPAATD